MIIYPAILSDSPEMITAQLAKAEASLEVETVQIDVIDGWFADNITVTPSDLVEQEFGELQCDLHLMTEEPLDFVYEAKDWKSEIPVRGIIAQVEHLSNQPDYLRTVRNEDWKVGLSLNLFTPVSAIENASWEYLDIVQVMGIEAGFQGQAFHEAALLTIREVAVRVAELQRPVEILVDGGVTPTIIPRLAELGVGGVAVGSALWEAPDFSSMLSELQNAESR